MKLKPFWRQLHLWIGVAGGAVFALLGLSGSTLVYEEAILAALYPQAMHVEIRGTPVPPTQLLAIAQGWAGPQQGRVTYLRQPDHPHEPVRAGVSLPSTNLSGSSETTVLLIDQYAGRTIGPMPGWLFIQLFEFHTRLLLGRDGRTVIGWFGVALMLTAISGLVIWWPRGRQWRRILQVQWKLGWWRAALDLHKTGGFLIALPFVLQAMTGAAIAFREPLLPAMVAFGGTLPARIAATPMVPPRSLDQMAAEAERLLPGGHVTLIALPARPGANTRIRLRMPDEVHQNGRSYVLFDGSGAVLEQQNAPRLPAANIAFDQLPYPLHTGDLLGPVARLLLFITGLMPALLFATGFYLWLKRKFLRPA